MKIIIGGGWLFDEIYEKLNNNQDTWSVLS